MKVYFSDFFNIEPNIIESYGAFNISLINDLPLFIDPFLLFNSEKEEYKKLHKDILKYVEFLRDKSISLGIQKGLLKSWFYFPEVKQNWLGYSLVGNGGSGLGEQFAKALNDNLNRLFANFGQETISQSSHLEKLCLVQDGVGRDNISDFTTNLIKAYLLDYTQTFARKYIDQSKRKDYTIRKVRFDYETGTWMTGRFNLPFFNNDYVLLTPKDMLTKDEAWINKSDIFDKFHDIVSALPNDELRGQINYLYTSSLPEPEQKKKGKGVKSPTKKDIAKAISTVIERHPEFIDYYIRFKEDHGEQAKSISSEKVSETQQLFVTELTNFIDNLCNESKFYDTSGDTLEEAYQRILFLKNVIENKDGYRIFYLKGKPIKREADVQIMFRLT